MWLVITSGNKAGSRFRITNGFVVGRDSECDLSVDDDKSSRRHAYVSVAPDGEIVLHDLGSTNGTFVDGKRIDAPKVLRGGEELRVGETTLVTELDGGEDAASKDRRIGSAIGRYLLEERIGDGAMGVVYRARHVRLDHRVALKVLAPHLFRDERARWRFLNEAKLTVSLDHPNIIPVYDADEEGGEPYIAMRYVQGTDLAAVIDGEGPLAPAPALAILQQVGAALDAAHARGLVHRDVKPSNVLITGASDPKGEGHVFLCDFGITKHVAAQALTHPDHPVGTRAYMAPEQFKGETVDSRADIYALGAMLYEALTGERPYDRDSEEALMYAHLEAPVPSISEARPELPAALDDVIAKAMAKDRRQRFSTCAELMQALGSALKDVGALPPAPRQAAGERRRTQDAAADGRRAEEPEARTEPEVALHGPESEQRRMRRDARHSETLGDERGQASPDELAPQWTSLERTVRPGTVPGGAAGSGAPGQVPAGPAARRLSTAATAPERVAARPSAWEQVAGAIRRRGARLGAVVGALVLTAAAAVAGVLLVTGGDATPPQTTQLSGPEKTTESTTAILRFSSTAAGATFECSLDGGGFMPCSSPVKYSGLGAGTHSVRVRSRVGKTIEEAPAQWTWTVQPSAAASGLLERVNGRGFRCDNVEQRALPSGATASIVCMTRDSVTVNYIQFNTRDALYRHYSKGLKEHGVRRGSGSTCRVGPKEGAWGQRQVRRGQIACYTVGGSTVFQWTQDDARIYGLGRRKDLDFQAMYEWWQRRGVLLG